MTPGVRRRAVGALAALLLAGAPATAQEASRDAAKPRVLVVATGGTIASRPDAPQLRGVQIVEAVPEVAEHARISVEEFSRIGSSSMTPDHWLRLSKRIDRAFREDPELAGVVVTHGTDTMEETAYFLHLTVDDPRPVVMVGSMRSATALSADGPANLLQAVRVAVSPGARGKGTLVVLNGEIHGARTVTKMNNLRVDAFEAPELGALGFADPDTVVFFREPLRRHTTRSDLRVDGVDVLPPVGMAKDFTGYDGSTIRDWADAGVDGIVVEAFGGGRASPGADDAIREVAARGIPVVVASRVPGGRTLAGSTSVDDERVPLSELGIVTARNLNAQKARVLLMLALTRTTDGTEIQEIFDAY